MDIAESNILAAVESADNKEPSNVGKKCLLINYVKVYRCSEESILRCSLML